jgi:hypothetical protein
MIIKCLVSLHYSTNIPFFLDKFTKKQFVTKFQNHCNEHEHHLLWIKDAPMYGINTNEEIEKFVDKYISCDVSLLPFTLQNA